MDHRLPTSAIITDARVDDILVQLNAAGAGLESLDIWAAQSSVKPDRVIQGPDITYVRLAGEAEQGGPVVLMHFERCWERAIHRRPASSRRDGDRPSPSALRAAT